MAKLRFAQIGVTAIHAPKYRDSLHYLQNEIELCGFYDPDPASARATLSEQDAAVPWFDTIEELLADKPDAVMISGYSRDMPGWLAQAAEAGVHCWIDKPFAIHSGQLLPAKAAIEQNQLIFSCGYSWRFDPITLHLKELWDAGIFGTPYGISIEFFIGNLANRPLDHWMFDPELNGGGILHWLGCHWIDLMRYLTGAEISDVSAVVQNVSGASTLMEDAASLSLRFANGMIGNLFVGNLLPSGSETGIRLFGSQGAARWNPGEERVSMTSNHPGWEGAPKRESHIPRANLPGYGSHGAGVLRAFVRAIRGQGSSGYTIDDCIRSLQIIEAAYQSSRERRAVVPGEALLRPTTTQVH